MGAASKAFKLASKTLSRLDVKLASAKMAFKLASRVLTGAAVVFTIRPMVHRASAVPMDDDAGAELTGNQTPPEP